MIQQHAIHLQRADLFAAPVDDLLQPPGQRQIALAVQGPLIASAEPAPTVDLKKVLGVGVGVAFIARRDVRPRNHHLARAVDQAVFHLMRDAQQGACGDAHRSRLLCTRRQGVAGHLMGGFGHAVSLDHRSFEGGLQLQHHLRGQRRRGRAQEPQRLGGNHIGIAGRARQDRLMHGRHGCVPGGLGLTHPTKELQRIKPRRAPDRGARGQRGADGGNQPVNVEQGHHVQATIRRRQGERCPDVVGGCHKVRLQQRHDLGPRCGARGVQDQRRRVHAGHALRGGLFGWGAGQAELPRRATGHRMQPQDRQAQRLCRRQGRAFITFQDHQRLGVEVVEIEAVFLALIGGVQRRSHRRLGNGHKGRRHLWPIGQHNGDPVRRPNAKAAQGGRHIG